MLRVMQAVETRIAVGLAVALAWSVGTTTSGAAQAGTCVAPTIPSPAVVPGGDASGAAGQPGPAPESPQPCWTWAVNAYTMTSHENDILAIGDIVATVAQNINVVALDATDGTERWRYRVNDQDYGEVHGMAAGDGAVYAGGAEGLAAIEASDGSLRWHYDVANPDSPNPQWGGFLTPAAIGGAVFGVTRTDDAQENSSLSLVALDAATGAERWAIPLSTSEISAPASDGTVVAVVYYTLENDLRWPNLGVFDALTGESLWVSEIRDVEKWPTSRPVVTADLVLLAGQDGEIVARSKADGSRAWRRDIGGISEAFTVVGGTLFANTNDSVVHALNVKNGKERWAAAPKQGSQSGGSMPAVVQDGPVIVSAAEYEVGSWLYALDPKTGKEVWRVESGPSSSGSLGPIISGGRIVVGLRDGEGDRVVSFGTP